MGWIFPSIAIQYVITAGVALLIIFLIYKKQPPSPTKNALFLLGTFIAAWQITAFLHRTAPSAELSKLFLIIDDAFFMAIGPMMLLALLNAYRYRRLNLLVLLFWPLQFLSTLLFSDIKVELSEMYGWTYAFSFHAPFPALMLTGAAYAAPIFGVIMVSLKMMRSLEGIPISSALKRKFTYLMLAIIISQALGVPITNLLLFAQPEMPPFGGFIQLVSLIFLWQAMHTKRALEVPVAKVPEGDLPSAYAYFLSRLQEKAIPEVEIGERSVQFYKLVEFLGLKDAVRYGGPRIVIEKEAFNRFNPISLLDRLLSFMEVNEMVKEYADYALGVINTTGLLSTSSEERLERFNDVVKLHFDLLDESDLIAGISYGRLAHLLYTDRREEGWMALIRIYKRALLSVLSEMERDTLRSMIGKLSGDFKRLGVEIGPFGDVSMVEFKRKASKVRDKEDYVLNSLSEFVVDVYVSAFSVSEDEGRKFIEEIKPAFIGGSIWHKKAFEAVALKLLSKVPYELAMPFLKVREESPFSSKFGIEHKELIGKAVILEFEPRRRYENLVSDFVRECFAHGEGCVVFTRHGSRVHRKVSDLGARVVKLAYVKPSSGEYAPLTDGVKTLDVMNRLAGPLTAVVFDNLTDLIVSLGEEETYTFAIQALEILGRGFAPSLFLINGRAHEERTVKAFEALFPLIVSFVGERAELVR